MSRPPTPQPLRSALDIDMVCRDEPCACVAALGSYWPYSRSSFESHVVKGFKECVPTTDFEPHITALARFYAQGITEITRGRRVDWIVRVLGSAESGSEADRPLSRLTSALCELTGAREANDLFFRSGDRPPMRLVKHLSGSEAFRARVKYVSQDLFIRPRELTGTVLLVDDIANTGATIRLYAHALKAFAGVDRVEAINLAYTRFANGKDGHGFLQLDTTELESDQGLRQVAIDSAGVFHLSFDCPVTQAPSTPEMRFLAQRRATPCSTCCSPDKPRPWWKVW